MTEAPSSETLFPPKKRLKSAVWDYFGYTKNDQDIIEDDLSPICKTCRKKVAAKGSNTSNLTQHLRHHHPALDAQLRVIHNYVQFCGKLHNEICL